MSAHAQKTDLFRANSFRVVDGVATGDALALPDALFLDDIYRLDHGAMATTMLADTGRFVVAACGTALQAQACLRFLCSDGWTSDALLLTDNHDRVHLCPLDPIRPGVAYRLIDIDQGNPTRRFAQATAASFVAGTLITMADGSTQPVEMLQAGHKIKTLDHGPQSVSWVGQRTLRAHAANAPVTIKRSGHALSAHPAQRLCLQSMDRPVQAAALIGNAGVSQQTGGFVDYVHLQFEKSCVIKVQDIWAESCLMDLRSVAEQRVTDPALMHVGRLVEMAKADARFTQGLTAANVPSNLSPSDPSEIVPKATPATASAVRP